MKKKLEAELISIAHRILKMKSKSDLVQLHQEAQNLYEKLSVLRFVDEHLADAKPTIGYTEVEDKLAVIFDSEPNADAQPESTADETEVTQAPAEPAKEAISNIISGISEKAEKEEPIAETQETETASENEPIAEADSPEEQVAEAEAQATEESEEEDIKEEEPEPAREPEPAKIEEPKEEEPPKEIASESPEDLFKPAFEWGFEAKAEEPQIAAAQISFDDLLGQDYKDPVFVKPEEVDTPMAAPQPQSSEDERRAAELAESNRRLADLRAGKKPEASDVIPISRNFGDTSNVISINKAENLNDRVSKGITIGLNDRIAFMKHLFNNSSEDYNRVLSQLITIDTLAEAQNFIDTMVKPDYNNWEGKEEYEQRFMEIVEKKFS